ncbi:MULTISPECIES: hypothetical protein [Streptomyces]|uniref:ANTAR domain-containing protein n=1 Tax=Streptomyces lonegramiae TaxID=3075524 RepID=A0ABU2XCZ7_9ACTN|nr:hypothetical protein [Streptomyces sp. DSM 41529]MDT0543785.1 hypothetical protein [Streptomyces sp. DSM 41529]
MNAMTGLRLLPWTSPDGKPCYLAADHEDSPMSRRADEIEALQLSMGTQLLGHARALLGDHKADAGELRFLANRLCEALRDVLRVAESRGRRLPAHDDDGTAVDPDRDHRRGNSREPGRWTRAQ